MTILQAIERTDGLIHNTYTQEEKVRWLSLVDSSLHEQLMAAHEGPPEADFSGYGSATSPDTVLLVPEPYSELYIHWLEARIHYYNGEYGRYNQAYAMYDAALKAYARQYHRSHMPKGTGYVYF